MLEYPLTGLHVIKYDKQNRFYLPKNMRKLLAVNNLELGLSEDALLFNDSKGRGLDSAGRLTMPHQDFKVMIGQGDCFQFFNDVSPAYNGQGFCREKNAPYVGTYDISIDKQQRIILPKELVSALERNVSKLEGVYMSYHLEKDEFFFTEKPVSNYDSFEFLPIGKGNRITIPDYFGQMIPKGKLYLAGELTRMVILDGKKEISSERVLDLWEKL
ncbi:hypothetical protein KY321_01985 [Candidatus Woesearchaeota archaeon]|nr:hypothetical protein [Candidatus Woesearchaeota archaeon]